MSVNKTVAAACLLGATLGLAVVTPASAAQDAVTVKITNTAGYEASLCAADQLEGRCLDSAKKGETRTFTVKPGRGRIEVRVVVKNGGSALETFAADGPALTIDAGGSAQQPTATKAGAQDHGNGHGTPSPAPGQTPDQPTKPATGKPVFFTAELDGRQEVPTPGGPAVGDEDASAKALVEVRGDRVTFALEWKKTSQLSLGHIHQGAAGQNGAVKVNLFTTAMPETLSSAAGQTVVDPKLAEDIRKNPAGFYVNLHSTEKPGGAVRGQLTPLARQINPLDILKGGKLRAFSNGRNEVPVQGGPKVGDPDGQAVTLVRPTATGVDFSLAWVNVDAATLGHVHQGAKGVNGAVKITFFGTAVPNGIFAVSGTATADKATLDALRQSPQGFYSNIHTAAFPGGAVRGQFTSHK
ncbi:CHRD domain-containing protein [Lentzea sp. BCCO 10_0798]|uniref:CHRD domain-containing protein n=1 Tax=Lentzea kristufekii TaxID=3095430 RepID=A0ABU4TIC2_9PSEU|nr:CHRD domain-containing protein [Lentzea sp. BCCO 10_0798]MDX8048026.1 CHRD domain-containing protein [Lentzea sp. BCCO 10_0798]